MTASRGDSKPGVLASALRIFDLSFGQMLWSRRSIFLALVVGGPIVLGGGLRLAESSRVLFTFEAPRPVGAVIYGVMMWLMYVRFLVPVLGAFYGTSLIADEVEDKTLTYLFTRPIRRSAVILGKYLAYLVCTVLLLLPSVVVVFFLVVPIGGGRTVGEMFPVLLADLGMLVLGLAAYGALFAFIGARFKRPLLAGLLFALGWEPAVGMVPGYLKRLTVAYYLQALVSHDVPQPQSRPVAAFVQVFWEVPSVGAGLFGLAVIIGVGLWLAAQAAERREYVLEQ
jgi:ABC-2 type transport system permease protein